MKYIITESQYNNAINRFITYQLEPHEEKTSKEYPNSIFWVKDGEIIVKIDKSKNFWVKIDIWEIISSMFSLGYNETQEVIKEWLEEHYNLGLLTPGTLFSLSSLKLYEN
jgi:hypothetical protein